MVCYQSTLCTITHRETTRQLPILRNVDLCAFQEPCKRVFQPILWQCYRYLVAYWRQSRKAWLCHLLTRANYQVLYLCALHSYCDNKQQLRTPIWTNTGPHLQPIFSFSLCSLVDHHRHTTPWQSTYDYYFRTNHIAARYSCVVIYLGCSFPVWFVLFSNDLRNPLFSSTLWPQSASSIYVKLEWLCRMRPGRFAYQFCRTTLEWQRKSYTFRSFCRSS